MTLLQMAGIYQTVANDGVRIPPRIIKSVVAADGTRVDEPVSQGNPCRVGRHRTHAAQHVPVRGAA